MPTLHTRGGDAAHFENAAALYDHLKNVCKFTSSEIVELATTRQTGGVTLADVPDERRPCDRICVMLSGRCTPAMLALWRAHPEISSIDFVAHSWAEATGTEHLPACDIWDGQQRNAELLPTLQAVIPQGYFLLVCRDAPDALDDASRIHSQLCGIAACYAMAVLNAVCKGVRYKTLVRCRSDLFVRGISVSSVPTNANTLFLKKIVRGDPLFCDLTFCGDESAMRVCLAFDQRDAFLRQRLLSARMSRVLQRFVEKGWLRPTKANAQQLLIVSRGQHLTSEILRTHRWDLTAFRWLSWHFYTPEWIIPASTVGTDIRIQHLPPAWTFVR